MIRGATRSNKSLKQFVNKTKINEDNVMLLKDALENTIHRINDNTITINKNSTNITAVGCVLFNSLINFTNKDATTLDLSYNTLDLQLIDTYPINLDIKDGVFTPIKTSHYYLNGSFEVNNTTKKHKLFELCLYDEYSNEVVFKIKQTLIGGFNTLPITKTIKLIGNPAKTYKYSFRAKGDNIVIDNIDFNLFRINGTMA